MNKWALRTGVGVTTALVGLLGFYYGFVKPKEPVVAPIIRPALEKSVDVKKKKKLRFTESDEANPEIRTDHSLVDEIEAMNSTTFNFDWEEGVTLDDIISKYARSVPKGPRFTHDTYLHRLLDISHQKVKRSKYVLIDDIIDAGILQLENSTAYPAYLKTSYENEEKIADALIYQLHRFILTRDKVISMKRYNALYGGLRSQNYEVDVKGGMAHLTSLEDDVTHWIDPSLIPEHLLDEKKGNLGFIYKAQIFLADAIDKRPWYTDCDLIAAKIQSIAEVAGLPVDIVPSIAHTDLSWKKGDGEILYYDSSTGMRNQFASPTSRHISLASHGYYFQPLHKVERDAEAFTVRGLYHWKLGEYENAVEDFTRAIQINPKDVLPYLGASSCFIQMGREHAGVIMLQEARKLGFNDYMSLKKHNQRE